MGEYASYMGQEIKIGTCESMYYLRADQAHLVRALAGNVDPIKHAADIRFRFPFPYEDGIAPGQFNDYKLSVPVHGAVAPEGVAHSTVQFVASAGYNVCLPCPEGPDATSHGLRVHRNGFGGAVCIVQQRVWNGHLATVCECGGCGTAWRMPEFEDAEPIVTLLRSEADACLQDRWNGPDESRAKYLHTIADRITEGYANPPAWVRNVHQPA